MIIPLPLPAKVVKKEENKAIFEIQGAPHEFSTIPGVQTCALPIFLNLKNLRFKIHEGESQKVELSVKGEKEVTGADFNLSAQVELANPELHLATITDKKTELNIEITIEKGIGYEPKDRRHGNKKAEIGAIAMDAIFTPIKNVNFSVENMRVGDRTDFDKLSLEIQTDGTLTPNEAFYKACEILIKHFTLIFEGKEEEKPARGGKESKVKAKEKKKSVKKSKNAKKK